MVLEGLVLESRNRSLEALQGSPGPTFLPTFVVLQAEVRGIRYLLTFNPCVAPVLTDGDMHTHIKTENDVPDPLPIPNRSEVIPCTTTDPSSSGALGERE